MVVAWGGQYCSEATVASGMCHSGSTQTLWSMEWKSMFLIQRLFAFFWAFIGRGFCGWPKNAVSQQCAGAANHPMQRTRDEAWRSG